MLPWVWWMVFAWGQEVAENVPDVEAEIAPAPQVDPVRVVSGRASVERSPWAWVWSRDVTQVPAMGRGLSRFVPSLGIAWPEIAGRTWYDGTPDVLPGARTIDHVLAVVPGVQGGLVAGDRPALMIDGWPVGGTDGRLGLAGSWKTLRGR